MTGFDKSLHSPVELRGHILLQWGKAVAKKVAKAAKTFSVIQSNQKVLGKALSLLALSLANIYSWSLAHTVLLTHMGLVSIKTSHYYLGDLI
jgi:hypothetical protein